MDFFRVAKFANADTLIGNDYVGLFGGERFFRWSISSSRRLHVALSAA
jgi:hypothetical protein